MGEYIPPKEAVDRKVRMLPAVLQHVARVNPDRVYASCPITSNLDDGLRDITFSEVLKATDALTGWLLETLGRSTSFETLTYVGVNDLRYALFFQACIKTGYKALFVSPRNTAEQNSHLMKIAGSKNLFYSTELTSVVEKISAAAETPVQTRSVEPFDHWLSSYTKPYPYTKTYEEARFDPIVVLHSSGSTGPPKVIVENHQFVINYQKQLPPVDGRMTGGLNLVDYEDGGWFYSSFPFCHLGGVTSLVIYPIYSRGGALLIGLPDRPGTPEMALQIMRMRRTRTLFTPPSIIEGVIKLPGGLDYVKKLDYVLYAGGPLAKSCGDLLAEHTTVASGFGSTETGTIANLVPKRGEWGYLEFHPDFRTSLEPDLDNTYHLVLYKNEEADYFRPIGGTILRDSPVYETKDLFVRHPTNPNLWQFYGRKDDIIVFANSQKWNPVPSENHIASSTAALGVEGVLIAGLGRTEPAVLIELSVPEGDEQKMIEKVWPAIDEANQRTQRYGRVGRSRITFVKPGSFLRTGKGTVVRMSSLKALADRVEAVYSDDDGAVNGSGEAVPDDLIPIVRAAVHEIRTVEGAKDTEDLFVRGMDSLEAAELARSLKVSLRKYAAANGLSFLQSRFIFSHPRIDWIAAAIKAELTGVGQQNGSRKSLAAAEIARYEALLKSSGLKPHSSSLPTPITKVAVTGTTGSLGSRILEHLLDDTSLTQILCLNRNPKAESAFQSRYQNHPHRSKATFLTIDLHKPSFGLSDPDLTTLSSTHAIIHSAWEVNFNRSLSTYAPQLDRMIDLVRLSLTGPNATHLSFISSISAAAPTSPDVISAGNSIPETLVREVDDEDASRMGYAASKNVAEHILGCAASTLGLPATVLRVGQIAGPTPGRGGDGGGGADAAWTRREWVPSLVDTAANLGALPADMADVDWVPVDVVARTVVDAVAHDAAALSKARAGGADTGVNVYNIVNPSKARWADLVPAVNGSLPSPAQLVPFGEWVAKLRALDDGQQGTLERYPALKILPFFERKVRAEEGKAVLGTQTDKACAMSNSLKEVGEIDGAMMRFWMGQWGYKGAQNGKS